MLGHKLALSHEKVNVTNKEMSNSFYFLYLNSSFLE